MAGWILPSATRLFLVPAVAIIAIIITFLYNYAGLVIALAANFCLNTCQHCLISGYRSVMNSREAEENPLPANKEDQEPLEKPLDNIVIIGKALGLGHVDLDRTAESSKWKDDLKVKVN